MEKKALTEILQSISDSGRGSFLAVLKTFGKQDGVIAFPREGYTLALDFPIRKGLFEFLDQLDEIVLSYNGRIYLSKDARMSASMFSKSYSRLNEFKKILHKYSSKKFQSLLSDRLGISYE